jgi:hypothetical protein
MVGHSSIDRLFNTRVAQCGIDNEAKGVPV